MEAYAVESPPLTFTAVSDQIIASAWNCFHKADKTSEGYMKQNTVSSNKKPFPSSLTLRLSDWNWKLYINKFVSWSCLYHVLGNFVRVDKEWELNHTHMKIKNCLCFCDGCSNQYVVQSYIVVSHSILSTSWSSNIHKIHTLLFTECISIILSIPQISCLDLHNFYKKTLFEQNRQKQNWVLTVEI